MSFLRVILACHFCVNCYTQAAWHGGMLRVNRALSTLLPVEFGSFEVVVAREHKIPVDAIDGHKLGQQGCRELHRCSVHALRNNLPGRPTVVGQDTAVRKCRDGIQSASWKVATEI
jgi:hypothetical protein